jgi:hypothetical protein
VQNHLPPPRSSVWYHQTVRDILKNSFYAGIVQFEKSKVKKDRRFNRKSRDRHIPEEKIISAPGKHQPLWDKAAHLAIVEEMKRRARNFRGRQNNQFTALLQCGECGAQMWRFKNGPRAVPDRLIWRCSFDRPGHVSITHIDLLERVGRQLVISLKPYFERSQKEIAVTQNKKKNISLLDDLKLQLARLEDIYIRGSISIENYERRFAELNDQIKAAENKSVTAEIQAAQHEVMVSEITRILGKHAKKTAIWLVEGDPSETNRLLHIMLEGIVVNRDGIELKYR